MGYFCSFSSGSKGNCALYVDKNARILIDAGTTTKYISTCLSQLGLSLKDLTHVAVTHCHRDHVSALPVLMKHTGARLVCSSTTYEYLNINTSRPLLFEEGDSMELHGVTVRTAATPHDCLGSCCYSLGEGRGGVAVCTDMGAVTADILQLMRGCKNLFIESNHDLDMLRDGPYPYQLKRRIMSGVGHLSNADCAAVVSRLALEGMETVTLAHLSETNNTPALAMRENLAALRQMGASEAVLLGTAGVREMKMILEFE